MVRIILLLQIFLCGCIILKNDKPWNNSLKEAVGVQLIMPDMAYVGDTVSVVVEFHNKTPEQVCFYEPGFIALIEEADDFSWRKIITLEEKPLNDVSTIFELKAYDSIVRSYKLELDSAEFRKSAEIPFKVVLWSMPPCKKSNCPSFIKKGSLKSPIKIVTIKKRIY